MENLGGIIRSIRQERGWKVLELAAKVKISPVYMTQIEKHNKLPSPEVFSRIQKELGLPSESEQLYITCKYPELNVLDTRMNDGFIDLTSKFKNSLSNAIKYFPPVNEDNDLATDYLSRVGLTVPVPQDIKDKISKCLRILRESHISYMKTISTANDDIYMLLKPYEPEDNTRSK